jgi:hypothetical protein
VQSPVKDLLSLWDLLIEATGKFDEFFPFLVLAVLTFPGTPCPIFFGQGE